MSKKYYLWVILIILIIDCILLHFLYQPKFRDLTIEVGTKDINLNDFVVNKLYLKNSECLSNIDDIDLNKTGSYELSFVFNGVKESVTLDIIDRESPEVTFKDLTKARDYVLNPNDFVEDVKDYSPYTISADTILDNLDYGTYKVNVIVSDKYGNKVNKECLLNISFINEEVHHELGTKLMMEEIITDKDDASLVDDSILKSVDVSKEGTYNITIKYKDKTYESKVTVKDTLAPNLKVKDISIYVGQKISNNDFVISYDDNSKDVKISYEGKLDNQKLGEQILKITAVDAFGNKVTKEAKLTVKKDTTGPVFKGLSAITISKNGKIDYKAGVSAKDALDGPCEFTVDTSKVNVGKAGTYYAKYTSTDKSGNKTTKSRKIVVNPSKEDIDAEFRKYYNKYLKGKSVLEMVKYIHKLTGYNVSYGNPDPVYYMLTNNTGNCYVHAIFLKRALDEAGIKNMLIHTIDKTHYWVLVYQDGKWRHYDATPGGHTTGPDTDDEKYNSKRMEKRDWDRSAYPKAE